MLLTATVSLLLATLSFASPEFSKDSRLEDGSPSKHDISLVYEAPANRTCLKIGLQSGISPSALSVVITGLKLTPQEWDTAWDQAEKKCEHLMLFKKTDKSILLTVDDIQKRTKCFVSCFFDSVGLTRGTEINRELYRGWLAEELQDDKIKDSLIASVDKCVDGIERTEKCNTAYDLYECFGKKYFREGME